MSPRHRQNWIDNAVVFCIFSDLDIAVDDFKFFIALLIVDRFALYFVLRFVAIYLAYNCDLELIPKWLTCCLCLRESFLVSWELNKLYAHLFTAVQQMINNMPILSQSGHFNSLIFENWIILLAINMINLHSKMKAINNFFTINNFFIS